MKLVKNQMCFFFYQKCVNVLQITMHCINYTNTLILMFVKSICSQKCDAPDQDNGSNKIKEKKRN